MVVGLVLGLVMGGVAYAVVVNPPNAADRYYACVTSGGYVRAETIKRNAPPTKCTASTDQVRSWNAVGPTGVTGATGATGAAGAGGGYRSYVGTYTLRHTNTGCGAAQLRLELVAIKGAAPANPSGPCLDLGCVRYAEVLTVGAVCSLPDGYQTQLGLVPPGSTPLSLVPEPCIDVGAALGLADLGWEPETTLRRSGDPTDAFLIQRGTGPTDEYLDFYLKSSQQQFKVVSGRLDGCATLTGGLLYQSPLPSLVGLSSPVTDTPYWSVYSVA